MFTDAELSLAYENYKGAVVVAEMAKARPSEKTFRNNKYSVYNQGRLASQIGRYGAYSSVEKI